ncbi:MAG: outer membrane beta-barrel protein [Deltaproteobacteria bacterium]|nr:outer membrane beta-barrel protein [Deltaproteobacteria bacterium]
MTPRIALNAVLLACLLGAAAMPAKAEVEVGAGYGVVVPLGEMADVMGPVGHALDLELGYRFEKAWLALGGSLSWAWLGSQAREAPDGAAASLGNLRVRTDLTATLLEGFVRFQPRIGIVHPFVEALAGASFANRTASLRDRVTRELWVSGQRHTDAAFTWGAGAGALVEVFRPAGGATRFAVDLRVRYLGGLRTSRYGGDAIVEEEGVPAIDAGAATVHRGLHALVAHAGFILLF